MKQKINKNLPNKNETKKARSSDWIEMGDIVFFKNETLAYPVMEDATWSYNPNIMRLIYENEPVMIVDRVKSKDNKWNLRIDILGLPYVYTGSIKDFEKEAVVSNYIDHDDEFEIFKVGDLCMFADYKKAGYKEINTFLFEFATRFFLADIGNSDFNSVDEVRDALKEGGGTMFITSIVNTGKVNRETIWNIEMIFNEKVIHALLTRSEAALLIRPLRK